MRNFKIKKSKKTRLLISLIVIFLIIALVLIYFATCVNPVIVETSEAKIKSSTSRAVNSAVQTVINGTNVYDDIIEIILDDEGKIKLIQVNSLSVNKLSKEISMVANQNIDLISSQGVTIPLGTLSGIGVFVGLGPDITFRVTAISTIQSKFESEFISVYLEPAVSFSMLTGGVNAYTTSSKPVRIPPLFYSVGYLVYGELYITPKPDLEWYFEAQIGGATTVDGIGNSADSSLAFNGSTGITWKF